jgi:hypothetical protein
MHKFAANGTSGWICQSAKGLHPYEQVATNGQEQHGESGDIRWRSGWMGRRCVGSAR